MAIAVETSTPLRVDLERIAAAIGVGGRGAHELRARFVDGRLQWFERGSVREPASTLDRLAEARA